jgi:hypothetical protein
MKIHESKEILTMKSEDSDMNKAMKISSVALSAALLVSCAQNSTSSPSSTDSSDTATMQATASSTYTASSSSAAATSDSGVYSTTKSAYTYQPSQSSLATSREFNENTTTKPNSNAPVIRGLQVNTQSPALYNLFEVTVDLDAEYANPFDTNQIILDAEFTTPSGKKIVVPGFAMKEYKRTHLLSWSAYLRGKGTVAPGEEVWKIRFSSGETGTHSYKVRVVDQNGQTVKSGGTFTVKDYQLSDSESVRQKGPIEISPASTNYFRYRDSKQDYMPVGIALPWSWTKQYINFEINADKLAAAGGNFTRIWGCGIEQTMSIESKAFGPGVYHMQNAASQDLINQLMRDKGITVQYCFDSFTSLQSDPKWYGEWQNHPYNAAAGGFLSSPLEFFINSEAKRLFKQRIRYTVARYGWDTNLVMWEMFNEIDGCDPFYSATNTIKNWLDEMCRYLKSIDYYQRPISVSFAKAEGFAELNNLKSIDYVICHFYSSNQGDLTADMQRYVEYHLQNYNKPTMLEDPIYFNKSLHSSIEHGHANCLTLDICSVAYWYQAEPHKVFPAMRPAALRQNMPEIDMFCLHRWRDAWRKAIGGANPWGNELIQK